jgi:hypothetical protein
VQVEQVEVGPQGTGCDHLPSFQRKLEPILPLMLL